MKIFYKGKIFTEQDMDDAFYLLQKEKERITKEYEEQLQAQKETINTIEFKERD